MFSRVEVGRRRRVLTYFAAATNKIDISRYVPNVMIEDWLWLIPFERLSSFCVQNCTKLVRNYIKYSMFNKGMCVYNIMAVMQWE